MSISMPGMGTGLDIQGLAKKMAKSSLAGKNQQLTKSEHDINGEVSALNKLDSALHKFYDSLKRLSAPEDFGSLKHGMSDDETKLFTVELSDKAVANSYQIAVQQLAAKDKWNILQAGSSKEPLVKETDKSPGNIDITVSGKTLSVSIKPGDSLEDIMDRINGGKDNPGVDAAIITGSGGARLTLTSRETGTEHAITVNIPKGIKSQADHISTAQNARLSIDGIAIESQSNRVENALTGVTLNLKKPTATKDTPAGDDTPVTLDLSTDTDTMKKSIESLVESYNTLRKTIKQVSKSKPAEPGQRATRAPLSGDTLVSSLTSQLRTALISEVSKSSYGSLARIGIITKQNGDLEIDNKTLDKALEDNPSEVVDLFIGKDTATGQEAAIKTLMTTIETFIGTKSGSSGDDDDKGDTPYKPKKDGLIKERLDRLKREQTHIKREWDDLNKRADEIYQRKFKELNAMDQAVRKMKATMANLQKML